MTPGDAAASHPHPWEPSLHDLYENAPVGQVSVDSRDVIVKVNATLLGWLGATERDLLGTVFRGHLTAGSVLFYDTRFQPVLSLGGSVSEVSLTMRSPGGAELPVLVNARSVEGAPGEVRVVRLAIFDSTSRHGYERELLLARRAAETSEARVRVLQDASMAFGACTNETDLAVTLMESARRAVSGAAAGVLLCDDNKVLQPVDGSHPLAMELSGLVGSPVARAIEQLAPASLGNARDAGIGGADTATVLLAARFEAVTAVPLVSESETVGVLVTFFGRARSVGPDLIGLEQALASQAVQVLARIRLQAQLTRMALHDGLTGLANRTNLLHNLDAAIADAKQNGSPVAVMFLDLDGFKTVNDKLGHNEGDSVLRHAAARLTAAARPDDLVARFGGDEFVIVFRDTDEAGARALAADLVAAIAEPIADLPEAFTITASAGLVSYVPTDLVLGEQTTANSLLALADSAMYRSKQTRRGSITVVHA